MNGDAGSAQSHQFQAEVAELLNLMVHSVYSETDVFLRELISNASDALDKIRYEAISNPALLVGAEKLEIRLKPDATAKTLTIADKASAWTARSSSTTSALSRARVPRPSSRA